MSEDGGPRHGCDCPHLEKGQSSLTFETNVRDIQQVARVTTFHIFIFIPELLKRAFLVLKKEMF